MPQDYSDTTPKIAMPKMEMGKQPDLKPTLGVFPDNDQKSRVRTYNYYRQLFMGDHYEAFNYKIDNEAYNKAYSKLRYVKVNFAGLVSKICADMLFSEPLKISSKESDVDYARAIWDDNDLDIQAYESALANSYHGDAIFKIRIGKRHPNDKKSTVIIEDTTPTIYFPDLNPFNIREAPKSENMMWSYSYQGKDYLRKEIHTPGKIENKAFLMEGEKIKQEVSLEKAGLKGLKKEEKTKIEKSLIVHVPNYRINTRHFGISDYNDLDNLFYSINNRLTKTDNILDKHSDPILMVPPGVLDENGKAKKDGRVIEFESGEDGKAEYVVWDASLENAFKYIEKLVDFFYMIAEISPDALGMGEGVDDSGRALKFKLMRTIAKVARKKLYYHSKLRTVLETAQELGKAHGIEVRGVKPPKEVFKPDLEFADGLPIDESEQVDIESRAIDAGIRSEIDAIQKVYGLDEKAAEAKYKEIKKENELKMPTMVGAKNIDQNLNIKNKKPVDMKTTEGKEASVK